MKNKLLQIHESSPRVIARHEAIPDLQSGYACLKTIKAQVPGRSSPRCIPEPEMGIIKELFELALK